MYPYNHNRGQRIQTNADGVAAGRGFIAHLEIAATAAVAASDTAILAATTLADGTTTTVTTNITHPATPRALRIKGNVAGIAGDVVITGTNYAGEVISEIIAANGANAVDGNKAFKTVTEIVLPARNAAGNTISVGFNNKLGLPYKLAHNTVLVAYLDNVREGTAPTVTVSATDLENNTVSLNSALSGKAVDVYLIV